MNNRGTTEWTMAKLLTLVLGVFLLVIIIYGVQNKGFGPLVENIKGRYNEVLILLGVRDDGIPSCGDAFPETIDGVSGNFYPCEDNCLFVLDGENSLFGFTNFSIKGDGLTVSGDGVSDNDEAYRFGSAEAQRHKDAYDLLNNTVEEFLVKENIEYGDFVGDMSFDNKRTLYWEFDCLRPRDNCAYAYNGRNWKEGQIENGAFVKEEKRFSNEESVLKDLYSRYKNNKEVFVWYIYDENKRVILPTWIGDERFYMDLGQFKTIFDEAKGDWDKRKAAQDLLAGKLTAFLDARSNVSFYGESVKVEGGDIANSETGPFSVGGNQIYYNGQVTSVKLYKKKEGEYLMNYGFWNRNVGIIKDGKIIADKNSNLWKSSLDLRKILAELEDNYVFNGIDFIKSSDGSLSVKIDKVFFEDRNNVPPIFFNLLNREKLGIYYKDKKVVLFYNNEDSVVSDFVGLSDWDDFIKINKIYEHFKVKRCGNE